MLFLHFLVRSVLRRKLLRWDGSCLAQVVKEAGLNTSTRVLVTRGKDDISEVWQVLASKALHRRSPSPA